jgi:hypothetical protein
MSALGVEFLNRGPYQKSHLRRPSGTELWDDFRNKMAGGSIGTRAQRRRCSGSKVAERHMLASVPPVPGGLLAMWHPIRLAPGATGTMAAGAHAAASQMLTGPSEA